MRPTRVLRTAALAGSLALTATTLAATAAVPATSASPAVEDCLDGGHSDPAARVRPGATAKEPALYTENQAKQYGVIPDRPTLPAGSVTVDTVFHVISATDPDPARLTRLQTMVAEQMDVLNAAYSGDTAPDAADTPFRFDLVDTNFVTSAAWANVAPGKGERDMKRALHQGDSETLNVYAADIGGGLLGWAYFPKGYNDGRDYIDGVVMLDESMPGGTAAPYNEGDTLTHEVGHWLQLQHTFANGCSAVNDGVADTPREASPQFYCEERDSCEKSPGTDPIHNFMDYTEDFCMDMFTPGQAARMSDAWLEFRAGGNG
jgi:hypothetical protein